jgi:hypothetical protein
MIECKRIAAVVTTYFPNSHAGVLVSKFLTGFATDEGLLAPRTRIVSLFMDQFHDRDVGLQLAHAHDVPVFSSIRAAMTLGGDDLQVDAVLIIGEHGDYPLTTLGQEMLPRRWFFEQVCGVIGEFGRPIPVFTDKHLSYRWSDARWMYDTAAELGVPLYAGSSLPVCWRQPDHEHLLESRLEEGLSIGFHMLERYGFHALEALQCQAERRQGGETGVAAVTCLSGDDVWRAADAGRWSVDLANAALAAIESGPGALDREAVDDPHVFLLEYVDGTRGTVLMLGDNGYVRKFAYAGRTGDVINACEFHTDTGANHAHFSYFGRNIEDFFLTGTAPSPVQRTLLTTGLLEAVMISRHQGGSRIDTPHLEFTYEATGSTASRPTATRPHGASLDPVLLPEPGTTPAAKRIPIGRDGTVRKGA